MEQLTTKEAMLERAVSALEKIKTIMGDINPVGVIQAFAGNDTPNGWLLCDGSAVSRSDYADLYSVIGDTYGAGDGTETFNLPNLTDKFVEGADTSGTVKEAGLPNIAGKFGRFYMPSNAHETTGAFSFGNYYDSTGGVQDNNGHTDNFSNMINLDASSYNNIYGNSTTVQPPALTMRYIIKY